MSFKRLLNVTEVLEEKLALSDYDNEKDNKDTESSHDIYGVMRVLDELKNNKGFKRIYKTAFSYERDNNRVSLIFRVDNLKRASDFNMILQSEIVKEILNKLEKLGVSDNLIKRLRNRNTYKLHLHGSIGIYQTEYLKF